MQTVRCYGLMMLLLIPGVGVNAAYGQAYPTKPIRIHTAGAGGGPDFMSRAIANEISGPLGQPVIVENRPAGFALGSSVANAAPDGYTLLVWAGTLWVQPMIETAPYDPVRDFAPIATLTRQPNILVVHPSLPVKTVTDLIKLAKSRPGELNYSSGATGAASHTAAELFKSMTDVNIVRIAYKGGSQEITDLLSGQVQMTFGTGSSMAPQIKSDKLRAIASAGSRRSVLFPDLPTVSETLPGFVSEQLLGFFAPGKTPESIIRRLNQETVRALDKPDVRERLLKSGLEPVGGTPEQLAESVKSEIARLSKVVKEMVSKPGG